MKVWIILIVPWSGVRYIDTMWADENHAHNRRDEVLESWKAGGNHSETGHKVYVLNGKIEDAAIKETKQ